MDSQTQTVFADKSTLRHNRTSICSRCVIRIIFGIFSLFVLVLFEISEGGRPAVQASHRKRKSCHRNSYSDSRASGSVKFNYSQFLPHHNCINSSSRKKTCCGTQPPRGTPDSHIYAQTETNAPDEVSGRRFLHTNADTPTHTCVCATGLMPLFSCERKKRMDMKSSWMQTLNSSSFWPPVANEKSRRDWIMYLKMYSLAWRIKNNDLLVHELMEKLVCSE